MNVRRRLGLALALSLALAALIAHSLALAQTAPPAAPAAPADLRARLAGTFRYVRDPRDNASLDAVADRAVADMNFLARAFARGRVRAGIEPPAQLTFTFPPNAVALESPRGRMEAPDSGAEVVRRGPRGHEFRLRFQLTSDGVVQTVRGAEMSSRTEYAVSPDGRVLTMRVHATSSHLSRPLVYTLVFRR